METEDPTLQSDTDAKIALRMGRMDRILDLTMQRFEEHLNSDHCVVEAGDVAKLLKSAHDLADRVEGLHRKSAVVESAPESMRMQLARETKDEQKIADALAADIQELSMMVQALNPRLQAEAIASIKAGKAGDAKRTPEEEYKDEDEEIALVL